MPVSVLLGSAELGLSCLGMYTVGKRRRVLAILMTLVLARAQSDVLMSLGTYTYMYRLQLRLARGQTQTLLH